MTSSVKVVFVLFLSCNLGAAFQATPFLRYRQGSTCASRSSITFLPSDASSSAISTNEPEEGQLDNAIAPKKRTIRKSETKEGAPESSGKRQAGERNNFMYTSDGHRIAYTEYLFDNSNEVVVCK